MILNDDTLKTFFGRLNGLSYGDQIDLKRSIGMYFDQTPQAAKFAVMACASDLGHLSAADKQNLLFVAGIACANDTDHCPKEKAEKIAALTAIDREKAHASFDYGNCLISDLLTRSTGSRGNIYKLLADLLTDKPCNIDCWSLLKDLDYWQYASVRDRWASVYLKTKEDSEKSKKKKK